MVQILSFEKLELDSEFTLFFYLPCHNFSEVAVINEKLKKDENMF